MLLDLMVAVSLLSTVFPFSGNLGSFLSARFLEFLLACPESNDPIYIMSISDNILSVLKGLFIASGTAILLHSCSLVGRVTCLVVTTGVLMWKTY